MVDTIGNIRNDYSSGGISNVNTWDVLDGVAAGLTIVSAITPLGWTVGACTSVYYVVRIIANEMD